MLLGVLGADWFANGVPHPTTSSELRSRPRFCVPFTKTNTTIRDRRPRQLSLNDMTSGCLRNPWAISGETWTWPVSPRRDRYADRSGQWRSQLLTQFKNCAGHAIRIDDLARPPITPPNTIRLVISAAIVLGLVKDAMPIDATIVAAGYDAATNNIELTIASDFFKQTEWSAACTIRRPFARRLRLRWQPSTASITSLGSVRQKVTQSLGCLREVIPVWPFATPHRRVRLHFIRNSKPGGTLVGGSVGTFSLSAAKKCSSVSDGSEYLKVRSSVGSSSHSFSARGSRTRIWSGSKRMIKRSDAALGSASRSLITSYRYGSWDKCQSPTRASLSKWELVDNRPTQTR